MCGGRLEPTLQIDVYEVKLGDEFLMSSLFTVAEIELAKLGLAGLPRYEPRCRRRRSRAGLHGALDWRILAFVRCTSSKRWMR